MQSANILELLKCL